MVTAFTPLSFLSRGLPIFIGEEGGRGGSGGGGGGGGWACGSQAALPLRDGEGNWASFRYSGELTNRGYESRCMRV